MGRITQQQIRVFAMFAVALISGTFASAYHGMAHNELAGMFAALSIAFIVAVMNEAYRPSRR